MSAMYNIASPSSVITAAVAVAFAFAFAALLISVLGVAT
jgi:hypothetical protein